MTVSPRPDAAVDGRRARWDTHRQQRRTELVDATIRAIRRHGAGVGMDDIASEAKTSKTVIYRHFVDRAGLYTAVAERVDARILHDVALAVGEPSSDDVRPALRAAIGAYLHLVAIDPALYRFIVNAPLLSAGDQPSDPAAGMTTRIADLVAELFRTTGAGDHEAVIRGTALVGMVRATADAWLSGRLVGAPTDPDELADRLTHLACEGLGRTID